MNILNIFKKEPKNAKERAVQFAKKHGLQYMEFNDGYHMRVRNESGQYVDFWTTGKMRQVNGQYSHVGHKGIRLQVDLDILIGKYPKTNKTVKIHF